MHEQDAFPVQVDGRAVRQDATSGLTLEPCAEQEIPVAVHQEAGHARESQRTECVDDLPARRFRIVIADPGLEQVAEYVQCAGRARLVTQEAYELRSDARRR